MKYSEIIGLQEYFHPIFNIENETINYWKQFIPNEQFNEVLKRTLSAIDTKDTGLRKSIWIQGTYGTGKSHAASVIKHLMWDEISTIEDYVTDRIKEVSLKAKLNNFRKQNKFFPVVIKGVGNITEQRTFALQIERSVNQSLKNIGFEISTKCDFDRLIDKVENSPINWKAIIDKYDELNILVSDKNDILNKLNASDIEFFRVVEDTLIKEGIHFSYEDISKWLVEINDEIKKKKIADGIIIFWDEFTSLMDSSNSAIINQIQNIAELSEKNNIFFYLISHRTPNVHSISKEDINRMNDRFHILQYRMEPITTYHILAATIKKLDPDKWSEKQNEVFNDSAHWDDLIDRLTNNNSATAKSKIKDLFPIHPYSAYLSTFIARNLGSTNRSIFEFIYDKELGFQGYIEKEINGERLLTADYLWDFFVQAFENDQESRFNQVLDKYRLNVIRVQENGENCSKVFKGILLLNILFKVIEVTGEEGSPVTPSTENISSLFIGSGFEKEIPEILTLIDEKGIITKTPAGDFLIEFSSLPVREIEQAKENVRTEFKDIISVLQFAEVDREIEKKIFRDNIYRELEIAFFYSSIENEHILRNRLNKAFKKTYTLRIAVFLPKGEYDNLTTVVKIRELARDIDFLDVIFVIVEEPFLEKNYEKFVDYIARKQVCDNHRNIEQSSNYDNYARDQVKEWMKRISSRYMNLIFRENDEKLLSDKIGSVINKLYSPIVFSKGIENINGLNRNANVWKFQNSIKAAEIFIFADDRNELEEKTSTGPNVYLKYLVKDLQGEYIITESLTIKTGTDIDHPLKVIKDEIDAKLGKLKLRSSFNIGEELKSLTGAPFGVYTNMPNMALLGFAMRDYIGDLYIADVGRPIEKDEMRDLVGYMFSYWQDNKSQNKLNVRFGSKEERELKKILFELFELRDHNSITDTRWAIINFVKTTAKFPLWALKYFSKEKTLTDVVDELLKLVHSSTTEIDVKLISIVLEKIKDYKYELKLALKTDNFRVGFLEFLKNIDETIFITEENFNEINDYLILNLQGEIGLWKEDEVKLRVYQWHTHKNQSTATSTSSTSSPSIMDDPYTPINSSDTPSPEKDIIIEKVRSFNRGEKVLKERIIKLLEENPQLISLINKYLD